MQGYGGQINSLRTRDMASQSLTEKQAYLAMFAFLEQHYLRAPSDEIGNLLGSMALLPDGTPADRAYIEDWETAVRLVLSGKVDAKFALRER